MKIRRAMRNWKLAKIILISGSIFWILETIYFLFVYGWHYAAINEVEKTCDKIVSIIWTVGIVLFISVLCDVLNFLLSSNKNPESIKKQNEKTILNPKS